MTRTSPDPAAVHKFVLARAAEEITATRSVGAAHAVVDAACLHAPRADDGGTYPRLKGRVTCQHCESLCHSETGLSCETGGDALYPCDTIRQVAATWARHPDYDPAWAPAAGRTPSAAAAKFGLPRRVPARPGGGETHVGIMLETARRDAAARGGTSWWRAAPERDVVASRNMAVAQQIASVSPLTRWFPTVVWSVIDWPAHNVAVVTSDENGCVFLLAGTPGEDPAAAAVYLVDLDRVHFADWVEGKTERPTWHDGSCPIRTPADLVDALIAHGDGE